MSVEDNKAVLGRHFNQVLNQGQLDVIDEIYTSDYVLDAPVQSDGSSQARGLTQGREQLKQRVTLFRTAFPDIHFSQDEVVGENDTVVVRYTYRGTHRGVFAGVQPSGRSISIVGILIAHLVDGKIREAVSAFDSAELMKQLGH
ncbi:MAG: ester cyclase [Chloroflexi bacterium]|nr:ester cyclase [Chloroflexota bacterium]